MENRLFLMLLFIAAFVSCMHEHQTIDSVARTEVIDYNLSDSERAIVWHTNDFALELFRQLKVESGDSSFAFSPLSIACLLNLTNNGANGRCSDEISGALGYQAGQLPSINQFFRKTMIAHYQQSADSGGVNPRFGHDIYMGGSVRLNKQFLKDVRENYFFTVTKKHLDRRTEKGEIDFNDVINLDMSWMFPFYDCGVDSFFVSAECGLLVPMMAVDIEEELCGYISTPEYTAVDIPLEKPFFHVLLMLPKDGLSIDQLLSRLTAKDFAEGLATRESYDNLYMRIPKFQIRNKLSFEDLLKKMGMLKLFYDGADLSGIGEDVSHVKHITQEADITVDEDGMHFHSLSTERLITLGCADEDSTIVEFVANHPFIYFLFDGFGNICLCGQKYG